MTAFAVTIALWMDALAARELAASLSRKLCREAGLQLLDQSVSLQRLGFSGASGGFSLRRQYGFEVSMDGTDRYRGSLNLIGKRLDTYSLPWIPTEETVNAAPASRQLT